MFFNEETICHLATEKVRGLKMPVEKVRLY